MKIRYAVPHDTEALLAEDRWISADELRRKIDAKQVLVLEGTDGFAGFLRYGLFWDSTPFLNMLRIKESLRGKGYGRQFLLFWEREMKQLGYRCVMTSTAQNETAQHFYLKLGYTAVGGFTPPGEPFEIILFKPF